MITTYRPLNERLRAFDRFNQVFERMLGDDFGDLREGWMPAVDIKETDKDFVFYAEIPGFKQEDIEVEVVGDALTMRGKREFHKEETREDYIRLERNYGSFVRSFSLDTPVVATKVEATYKDGILNVKVPKAQNVAPKKVPILAK